jgi:hypothetical protein
LLFKDTLKRFINSDHATTDAINGLFWILHEEPSALSGIFSRESSRLHMNERIKNLVVKAKKEIDSDLRVFEMKRELSKMTFHSEEEKLAEIAGMKEKIDAEISRIDFQISELESKSSQLLQEIQIDSELEQKMRESEKTMREIRKTLLQSNEIYKNALNNPRKTLNTKKEDLEKVEKNKSTKFASGEQVRQFILKGMERQYKDDPQMLSNTRRSFAVEGVLYLSVKETALRLSLNVGYYLGFGETEHKIDGGYDIEILNLTQYALLARNALKEAAHNLKALPKTYRSVPSLEINPDVSDATNRNEMLRFIGDVNEGLKMNVDAFASAMDAFLTSAEHA